ncbi:MAG: glycosyltransferase [Acidobacteriota bacterium]|nr:glycosyltransferase [Acidobacteriota bacterium]
MTTTRRSFVFLGLSITSTWGNGHATTYRGLLKELAKRGHSITFLERDMPWYSENREFNETPYCQIGLYGSLNELKDRFAKIVREADAVVVGSYVPDGIAVGRWVRSANANTVAFYDIDTPVTLTALQANRCEYLSRDLVSKYDLYLSFTGGPTLEFIENRLQSPCARPLYCSVDPTLYFPEQRESKWELAYLGTYAADRQPALNTLLLDVASRSPQLNFAVAGPQYPADIPWPENVTRIEHLPAGQHREFYNSQTFTLNVTRRDMVRAGHSPSVRLFEAAACGVPILTDRWPGLERFFEPLVEIMPVRTTADVAILLNMPADQRLTIADKARRRTLRFHTAAVRAAEFEAYVNASLAQVSRSNKWGKAGDRSSAAALL